MRRQIPLFLKRHPGPAALFQTCDWYRRLGRFGEAFRLLEMNEPVRSTPKTETERTRLLWAARFLNLMGAAELAEDFLQFFEPRTAEEYRIVGTIRMVQLNHESAVHHFQKWFALETDRASYRSRLNRINFAEALNDLGRVPEALAHLDEVLRESPEPLLQAIALGAQGELRARQHAWEVAHDLLQQSLARFPKGDRSPDRAFVLKWLGYTRLCMRPNQPRLGRRTLGLSLAMLQKARLRPEAWLDVYRLQALCGQLDATHLRWLLAYPGLSSNFRVTLPPIEMPVIGPENARLEIDLAVDEYRIATQWRLGVPDELRAAAAIVRAGGWGLPLVKLKSLLWRGEAHAFPQFEGRLHQIFLRLRREYTLELAVEHGYVRATMAALAQVRVHLDEGAQRRPRFLSKHNEFPGRDLGTHYQLGHNQTCFWLKRWTEQGWIMRRGAGRATRYCQVLTESPLERK